MGKPEKESHLGWIASIYDALGDTNNAKKYRELSANPPKAPPIKLLPLEKIEGDYLKSGLAYFNEFQKSIGGKPTKLDPALNSAAKKHAEYLYQNHFGEMITTEWHNEEKGKPGYIGKAPEDQAKAFGFKSSPGYFTGNTMGGFNNYDLFSTPEYLFRHLANTSYHRGLVVAPNFESTGLYRWRKGEAGMLVYFMSYEIAPEKYTVYMKLADSKKQIVFDKEWSFTTTKNANFF
ncbi:CAP domain-containing protein [Leptospira ilyithenensis]|uniref:SCP domain-containing protein n=1 Tax=Leptospira ilyithenensis TaxID=2484901 RepID=A0A4R9LM36_9LEPT|nr:CAP domain-containing protein [Leptospira ilyithenensis]TGN09116.1 hypothetical protein EHS11_12830 [Leptospira ilyithenensis]